MTTPQNEVIEQGKRYFQTYPEHLIGQITYQNHKLWLKRRPDSKKNRWHQLQQCIALLIRSPIFCTTVSAGGAESLYFEARRLALFKSKNIPVPEVWAVTEDFIVTQDVGLQLHDYLHHASPAEVEKRLFQAADAINHLHKMNLYHSRPSLKDMTLFEEQIFFIDLEENALEHMSLEEAQAKDIWLFLNSACMHASEDLLTALFTVLVQEMKPEVADILRNIIQTMKWLRKLLSFLKISSLGRDIRNAIKTNKMLEDYYQGEGIAVQGLE